MAEFAKHLDLANANMQMQAMAQIPTKGNKLSQAMTSHIKPHQDTITWPPLQIPRTLLQGPSNRLPQGED
jgi:hypothetical protein